MPSAVPTKVSIVIKGKNACCICKNFNWIFFCNTNLSGLEDRMILFIGIEWKFTRGYILQDVYLVWGITRDPLVHPNNNRKC